jgi:transcription initiation factor TFIIB
MRLREGLPEKASQATKAYYQQVSDANAIKDRKQEAAMTGCVFIACRNCDSEVYSFTVVPKTEICAIYKMLERFSNSNIEAL